MIKVRVLPMAKEFRSELTRAGFEEAMEHIPDAEIFWEFLNSMVGSGVCTCHGSGGAKDCDIRDCAKSKEIEVCVTCENYPCRRFDQMFRRFPVLAKDNQLLRDRGMDVWLKFQEDRSSGDYVYPSVCSHAFTRPCRDALKE